MTEPPQRPRHARDHDGVFRILVVCTGNICRSPLTVQLLHDRLPPALSSRDTTGVEVTSAGTSAIDGSQMPPAAVREAVRLGIAGAPAHRARLLAPEQIERADLVIAMAREHRDAVVRTVPRASHRTFTLIELTHSLEALATGTAPVPPDAIGVASITESLRNAVAAADVSRAQSSHKDRGLDIADPYRRKASAYRRSADAAAQHVDRMLAALGSLVARPVLAGAGEASRLPA